MRLFPTVALIAALGVAACSQPEPVRTVPVQAVQPMGTPVAATPQQPEQPTVTRHIVFEHGGPPQAAAASSGDYTRCARVNWHGDEAAPASFNQAARQELAAYLVGQKFADCAGASAPSYLPAGFTVLDTAVGADPTWQCTDHIPQFNNQRVCFVLIPDDDIG